MENSAPNAEQPSPIQRHPSSTSRRSKATRNSRPIRSRAILSSPSSRNNRIPNSHNRDILSNLPISNNLGINPSPGTNSRDISNSPVINSLPAISSKAVTRRPPPLRYSLQV